VDVVSRATTPPLGERIVALAFAGDDRVLVLSDAALSVYQRDGMALRRIARGDLPGPLAPVRFPGGLLAVASRESACWAMTSRSARAALFTWDGASLTLVEQADALPWPGAARGLRFRPGTNVIEGTLDGLDGPWLALEASGWAVTADGQLARNDVRGPAAGPALARPWPGLLAVASAEPPGEQDRILLLRETAPADRGALRVMGAVRALAARGDQRSAVLAAATEDGAGGFRIELFELAERAP
jgi:hypothetical protein